MEFLKELFGADALTYDQLAAKVAEKKLNVVDISGGQYVGRGKYDDQIKARDDQIKDLQGQLSQRDTDIADLNGKLTAAQGDAGKLAEVQQSLTALQDKYAEDTKALNDRLTKQDYEFRVKEKTSGIKFSSESARRAFLLDAIAEGFKVRDDGVLQGYDDFLTAYKEKDPGAFVPDTPAPPEPQPQPPQIVAPGTPGTAAPRMTLSEMMKQANGMK